MKKHQEFQKLEQAWRALTESYAGLSDAQLMEPGVMGEWSVKDTLGAGDHLGGGGALVSAADPHRKQAAALQPVRRHRCLQCAEGGTETEPDALRGPKTIGGNAPSAPRLPPKRARRALRAADALPPSSAARYLPPLPPARQGDTRVAGAASGITGGSEGGEARVQLAAHLVGKPLITHEKMGAES